MYNLIQCYFCIYLDYINLKTLIMKTLNTLFFNIFKTVSLGFIIFCAINILVQIFSSNIHFSFNI